MTRSKVKNITGTHPYYFDCPEITSGESWFLDFELEDGGMYLKYLPFDFYEITNNSSYKVSVNFNDSKGRHKVDVLNGTIKSDDTTRYFSMIIKNEGVGTISAGEVVLLAQRTQIDSSKALLNLTQKVPFLSRLVQ